MDTSVIADTFDLWVDDALIWVSDHGAFLFDWVRAVFEGFYDGVLGLLTLAPWFAVALVFGLIAWRLVSLSFGVLTAAGLAACWMMGLWPETMSTFALVICATCLALALVLPIGVLAGFLPRLDRFVEPVLDLIQTLPPYIYLLPAIALLGFGPATALAATLIVAMPPAIRLTALGIRRTPVHFLELGQATRHDPGADVLEDPAALRAAEHHGGDQPEPDDGLRHGGDRRHRRLGRSRRDDLRRDPYPRYRQVDRRRHRHRHPDHRHRPPDPEPRPDRKGKPHDLSPGAWMAPAVDWLNANLHPLFAAIAAVVEAVVGGVQAALLFPPALVVIAVVAGLAWLLLGIRPRCSRSAPSASAW